MLSFLTRLVRSKPRCNICGGTSFGPGPQGRLSDSGKPPYCKTCRSLERHRAFHKILQRLGPARFKDWRCLMFSNDATVRRNWFADFEVSIYGGKNSLDLQNIARADQSYDAIICNHILEHVADYRAALRELRRILNPDGFILLSFPDPHRRQQTEDWGFAREDQHGHYRIFGRDVEPEIAAAMIGCEVVAVAERDDVTGFSDTAYVVTGNPDLRARLGQ